MNLYESDAQVAKFTESQNSMELNLCREALANTTLGFNLSRGKAVKQTVEHEVIQLLSLGFRALRWSLEQLTSGYYEQSIASSRLAWDAWLNGVYLENYPDEVEAWRDFDRRPTPAAMRKLVALKASSDELAAEAEQALRDLYVGVKGKRFSGYSAFSHASSEAIATLLRQGQDGEQPTLLIAGEHNEELLFLATHLFLTASDVLSSLFLVFIPDSDEFLSAHTKQQASTKEWASKRLATRTS
jgi:hypothetical protein